MFGSTWLALKTGYPSKRMHGIQNQAVKEHMAGIQKPGCYEH